MSERAPSPSGLTRALMKVMSSGPSTSVASESWSADPSVKKSALSAATSRPDPYGAMARTRPVSAGKVGSSPRMSSGSGLAPPSASTPMVVPTAITPAPEASAEAYPVMA